MLRVTGLTNGISFSYSRISVISLISLCSLLGSCEQIRYNIHLIFPELFVVTCYMTAFLVINGILLNTITFEYALPVTVFGEVR